MPRISNHGRRGISVLHPTLIGLIRAWALTKVGEEDAGEELLFNPLRTKRIEFVRRSSSKLINITNDPNIDTAVKYLVQNGERMELINKKITINGNTA